MPKEISNSSRDLLDEDEIKKRIETNGDKRYQERIEELFKDGEDVYEDAELAKLYVWNKHDKSRKSRVTVGGTTFCRETLQCDHTDGVRGKRGFTEGIHCWEIYQTDLNDKDVTALQLGVGTETALLEQVGSGPLIGWDEMSWGWDLGNNAFYHDKHKRMFPSFLSPAERYMVPNLVHVVLDMDEGTLGFSLVNNPTPEHYAIAVSGLEGELYPMAATSKRTLARIRYIRRLFKDKSGEKRLEKSDESDPEAAKPSGMKDEANGNGESSTSTSGNASKHTPTHPTY